MGAKDSIIDLVPDGNGGYDVGTITDTSQAIAVKPPIVDSHGATSNMRNAVHGAKDHLVKHQDAYTIAAGAGLMADAIRRDEKAKKEGNTNGRVVAGLESMAGATLVTHGTLKKTTGKGLDYYVPQAINAVRDLAKKVPTKA